MILKEMDVLWFLGGLNQAADILVDDNCHQTEKPQSHSNKGYHVPTLPLGRINVNSHA